MSCSNCNHNCGPDYNYCPQCGRKVGDSANLPSTNHLSTAADSSLAHPSLTWFLGRVPSLSHKVILSARSGCRLSLLLIDFVSAADNQPHVAIIMNNDNGIIFKFDILDWNVK